MSVKNYSLGFDYYNNSINKFFFGIVEIDLDKQHVVDICEQIITEQVGKVDPTTVTIKITMFNNIE